MRYETTVDIQAPAAHVWRILTDVERWPEWTASMVKVERLDDGEFGGGSTARVQQPKLPAAVWTVTDYSPGHSFTWISKSPGVTTIGGHYLTAVTGERTTARLTVDQTGPLAPLIGLFAAKLTRRYVDMEAQGLKRRAE